MQPNPSSQLACILFVMFPPHVDNFIHPGRCHFLHKIDVQHFRSFCSLPVMADSQGSADDVSDKTVEQTLSSMSAWDRRACLVGMDTMWETQHRHDSQSNEDSASDSSEKDMVLKMLKTIETIVLL